MTRAELAHDPARTDKHYWYVKRTLPPCDAMLLMLKAVLERNR